MTWNLSEELAAVRAELARVDAKCATLAALAGAAAAFTATQAAHGPLAVRAAAAAAGLAFTAAVLVLLLAVLRPRFGGSGFCRYAALSQLAIRDLARYGWTDDVQHGRPRLEAHVLGPSDLSVLSKLAYAKYRRLRLAVDLMSAGVALLAAAVVAGVIA
jgi:Pycsar effector protein